MPMQATEARSGATRDRRMLEEAHESNALALFTTLARTGLFLDALQRECLGQHGLTFTEFSVLRLLQRASEQRLPPSLLAEEIVCTTGAMTKLVDRLQRNDFVARAPDPTDRRGILVQLTASGDAMANEAAETYRTGRTRILARLDDRDSERLHTHLGRLLEAFESDRDER